MDWLALSLDMYLLENRWGRLARDLYSKKRQLATIEDLKVQFKQSCFSLNLELLQTLVLSMPDRVFKLLQQNG